MKTWHILSFILIAAIGFNSCKSNEAKQAKQDPEYSAAVAAGKIYWLDIDKVQEKMKSEPKKIMVDAYTSWCGWCKRMDKQTFEHPEIVKYVNDNFYAVKFDAETKTPINWQGKEYSFVKGGRRGYNQLAKLLLKGRLGYPTITFLDEDLNIIDAFPGFKDAHNFDVLAHFISSEEYKNGKNLNSYKSQYQSPIPPTGTGIKR